MDRSCALVAVLAAAVASACTGTPDEPTTVARAVPQAGAAVTVSGRALDYSTRVPVASASVRLVNLNAAGNTGANSEAITDAGGAYSLTIPPGTYEAFVGDRFAGDVLVIETGTRGDLLVDPGPCVARYGFVTEAQTHQPLAGVRVTLANQTATTGSDGSYRIDLGCSGPIGFNTTFIYFDLDGYPRDCRVVGRGIAGVDRLDTFLGRRSQAGGC